LDAQPLEWTLPHREGPCYAKLVCVKSMEERVVGFHVTGPNAGEMTQGYGVAMRYASARSTARGDVVRLPD
jgi:thioredoxin reductase (NADPH)